MKKVLKDVSSKGQIIVLVGLQSSKSKCDSVYNILWIYYLFSEEHILQLKAQQTSVRWIIC